MFGLQPKLRRRFFVEKRVSPDLIGEDPQQVENPHSQDSKVAVLDLSSRNGW